jgi:hypothetical protein
MSGKIILSVGMPRAGSGWYYNLVHDLIVAAGGSDAREIRRRYRLGGILTEINCNIGALTPQRVLPVLVPAMFGHTFTLKVHAGPKPLALKLVQRGWIQPTYIYRDPRDALLSAYEYGQRKRETGRAGAFSEIETIEQGIDFMREYVAISEAWLSCSEVMPVRYEDLLLDYQTEADKLVQFLVLDKTDPAIQTVLEKYRPERGSNAQKGTHFVKGKIGRYRQVFTIEQLALAREVFQPYLEKMGYLV